MRINKIHLPRSAVQTLVQLRPLPRLILPPHRGTRQATSLDYSSRGTSDHGETQTTSKFLSVEFIPGPKRLSFEGIGRHY